MKKIHSYRTAHQGFTLLELGAAMFVLSAMLIATTVTLSMYYKRMHVQLVGQQYQTVNAAVSKYMKLYFVKLITLDATCDKVSLAVATPLSVPTSISSGACALSLPHPFRTSVVVNVANGLQPTVDELKGLGLIDGVTATQLQLQTTDVVYQASGSSGAEMAPHGFVIQIKKTCSPTGCTSGGKLNSLVFNAQPFAMGGKLASFNFDLEEELLIAGGADAAIASLGVPASATSYELKGDLHNFQNPIRDYTSSTAVGVGIRGIMAVQNVYDTSLDSDYARRDGTSTITGDWNFNDHNITGVDYLQAKSIYASDTMNANKFSAMRIKLPAITPLTGCDIATQSLGVEQDTGEIFICRVNGGGYGNPAEGTGWWKGVSSSSP
jgi:type II secretory pathway pseudopilin PulG